jgi:hypothetical protein
MAFLIFSSLVDGAADAVVAVVEAVDDVVAAVLSLVGAACLLHATRVPSDTTTVRGRKMRMVPSVFGWRKQHRARRCQSLA